MALKPLAEPPRFAIVDSNGILTEQGRRYFDTLWKKLGSAGQIPTESVDSSVVFNASNDAVVTWQDVDASAGKVVVANGWHRYEGDNSTLGYRTLGPFAGVEFSKPYNAIYYVSYDPRTGQYTCSTDYRSTLKNGLYFVGACQANNAFSGTGATAGGGGTATSGTGGTGNIATGERGFLLGRAI